MEVEGLDCVSEVRHALEVNEDYFGVLLQEYAAVSGFQCNWWRATGGH